VSFAYPSVKPQTAQSSPYLTPPFAVVSRLTIKTFNNFFYELRAQLLHSHDCFKVERLSVVRSNRILILRIVKNSGARLKIASVFLLLVLFYCLRLLAKKSEEEEVKTLARLLHYIFYVRFNDQRP
jgi:hypothetical protein